VFLPLWPGISIIVAHTLQLGLHVGEFGFDDYSFSHLPGKFNVNLMQIVCGFRHFVLDIFVQSDCLFDSLNRGIDIYPLIQNFIYRGEFTCSMPDIFCDFLVFVKRTSKRNFLGGPGIYWIFLILIS